MTLRSSFLSLLVLFSCLFHLAAQDKKPTDDPPQRGLWLLHGDVDPDAAIALAKKSEITYFLQYPDAKKVREARIAIDKAGMLNTRIYVDQGKLDSIHLSDNLADVALVMGDAAKNKKVRAEVMRVLRPGGILDTEGRKETKPFSKKADDWSHPYHGPDNNTYSTDKLAQGPFLTKFMAEPWYAAMPQMTVISGSKIFKVWGNRSSKQPSWSSLNTLTCMNAFNGTTLWTRKLKPGFLRHRSTIIATPETLFFADDVSCQVIDPETGKTKDEIKVPATITKDTVWSWMALQDGVLYALLSKAEPKVEVAKWRKDFRGAGWPWWRYKEYSFGFGKTIVAINPKTKKVLWHHKENDELDMRAMCMKNGRIYFHSNKKFFGCLDAKTGKLLWKEGDKKALEAIGDLSPAQNPYYGFITTSYVKCSEDALYLAGPMCKHIVAVSAKNGKYLWHVENAGNSLLILRKDAVYALGGGRLNEPVIRNEKQPPSLKLEPMTGKVLATFKSRDRCTRATGCADLIFTRGGRGGSTSVFDVSSTVPKMGLISPMRPACQDGVTIAHGQLFWGPWMCRCDSTQIGVISLTSAGKFELGTKANVNERLVLSENAQKVAKLGMTDSDWPVFRRDNQRTGRTTVSVPTKAKRLWTFKPAGDHISTAPVTAGGLIFTSGSDGAVRALDAKNGKVKWTAYTGGAIKYPPAITNDRAYVGSGDGYVYCMEATTGKSLWRFRAAPSERRIPVFGDLISTWPVGGGVLVDQGTVYAAAGNANYNGTHVYALNAGNGQIKWQNNDSGHDVGGKESGAGVQGHLLLHDNKIWMQGGNLTGIVSYQTKDGKFEVRGRKEGRYGNLSGKDLYLLNNRVEVSGLPMYFRQEDSHFIEKVGIPTPSGIVAVYTINPNQEFPQVMVALIDPMSTPAKPKALWQKKPFTENNAVAVGKNAIVVAGVNREGVGKDLKTTAGIVALDLKTGETLWKDELPAAPSGWGTAIDRDGHVIVTLQDGRVLCYGKAGS